MGRTLKCLQKIGLGCLRTGLCFFCFIGLIITLISGMLKFSLFDRDFYQNRVTDASCCKEIAVYVREDADANCHVYQLPFSVVEQQFSDEVVTQQCRNYIGALYDALCAGQDKVTVAYPQQGIYDAVYAYLLTQGTEATQAADDASYISAELADYAAGSINVLMGQRFIPFLSENVYRVPALHSLAEGFWLLVAATAIVSILLLFFGAKTFSKRLYVTAGTWFVAAATVFVPIWLLRRYDLPTHVVLAASPLKSLFTAFWNAVIDRLFYISFGGLLLAATTLVSAVAFMLYKTPRKGKNVPASETLEENAAPLPSLETECKEAE